MPRSLVVVDHHLQRRLGRPRGDEVRPELHADERCVVGMRDQQPADVFPRPRALLPEDRLGVLVVIVRVVERRVLLVGHVGAVGLVPVVAPSGQRPGGLLDVVLRVHLGVAPEAVGCVLEGRVVAQAEELHRLAGVVLVGRPLVVVGAVQPQEHGRVVRQVDQQLIEVSHRAAAQQAVLAQHVAGVSDARVGRRKMVVQVQRHALLQLVGRAQHAIQPPQAVVAPGVERIDRLTAVRRRRPCEFGRGGRGEHALHSPLEAELLIGLDLLHRS